MRLWHQSLIPYLDRQHLLGQHRECCALRGKGWGKKHATVNYVFRHSRGVLYLYHIGIMSEMLQRGYFVDNRWMDRSYRGKIIGYELSEKKYDKIFFGKVFQYESPVYPEHNKEYLIECINLLKEKNAPMDFEKIERKLLTNGNL